MGKPQPPVDWLTTADIAEAMHGKVSERQLRHLIASLPDGLTYKVNDRLTLVHRSALDLIRNRPGRGRPKKVEK